MLQKPQRGTYRSRLLNSGDARVDLKGLASNMELDSCIKTTVSGVKWSHPILLFLDLLPTLKPGSLARQKTLHKKWRPVLPMSMPL